MQLRLTTVTGYFLQDDPATDPKTFDYVSDQAPNQNPCYLTRKGVFQLRPY
jgi:hypothetical protein